MVDPLPDPEFEAILVLHCFLQHRFLLQLFLLPLFLLAHFFFPHFLEELFLHLLLLQLFDELLLLLETTIDRRPLELDRLPERFLANASGKASGADIGSARH